VSIWGWFTTGKACRSPPALAMVKTRGNKSLLPTSHYGLAVKISTRIRLHFALVL